MRITRVCEKNVYAAAVLALLASSAVMHAAPVRLRCESLENPLGIDAEKPNLSWQSDNRERNWRQSAYEILVASKPDLLGAGKADIWDSQKQVSGESVSIAYQGPALESRKRYWWTVRVWDAAGRVTQAAQPAWWEMGLLHPSDWSAKWIRWQNPEEAPDSAGIRWIWVAGQNAKQVAPGTQATFHLDFEVDDTPLRAALFLIARGDWKVLVNGHDAGQKPHWNEFDRRDIAGLLTKGKNSVDITVTTSKDMEWGPNGPRPPAPKPAALAALLKITHADGRIERIPTDAHWQAGVPSGTPGPAAVAGDLSDRAFGDPGPLPQPAALLRHEFAVAKPVRAARLYATALGAYEFFLNGKRVGNSVLTPGFTQFDKRVQYQTYDVTPLLARGENVEATELGSGWFRSALSWTAEHFHGSLQTRLLAQLEIEYTDGSRETVITDENWRAAESPIVYAEIYGGETYDARLEKPGWNTVHFNAASWDHAAAGDPFPGLISSQVDAPPSIVKTLRPESVKRVGGAYVFDMGQNMVGWVALRVKGHAGATVRLRFAEILNPDGSIYTTNLRNADATDRYTLRGNGVETYAPTFTFHGFRYVEVSGYPGEPALADITGQVVSSLNQDPAATITTSSDLVNRMWGLGIWGQRSNFLSVPTDCPQRDERLGWMADAAVFWRTGSYNFDIGAFTHKWMRDVRDAQSAEGAFSNVSPTIGVGTIEGAPGWGDAGVIVPWTTWIQYGDRSVIQHNWDAMNHWMQFIQNANPDFIRRKRVGPDFADWLAPDPNTPKDLVDTAYWALVANMMSEMANATGRTEMAKHYAEIYADIRTAFQKEYVKPDGTVGTGTQTSYVVALHMKLLPPELEQAAVDKLVASIKAHNNHLTTGFLGTPYILFALANHGQLDVAYELLLSETYPSWGYMIKKGATTWWERWNGDTGDPAMNSYNHYAFGSVMAWVHQNVAGIDTTTTGAGFHEITIHPHPNARMTSARAEYESVYGKIAVDWNGTPSGPFALKVTIPANTAAKVIFPNAPGTQVYENGKKVETQLEAGERTVKIGAGSYEFQVK
ncbi:MAG TPA: family 78 glycoside hydrolase catalytic domain [Bryobacteraceae bacterium]|nr:family 78 glycoside hydrolase catalytic domain [Bryobacteraceae bacterium]